MIGKTWNKEQYVLGYKPKSKTTFDIGFNWACGNKWKNKSWPKEYWQKLEATLKKKYSISWQKGLNNLYEYMEWVNSCRTIITNDSLGVHLATALKKNVIVLFGPSSSKEVYLYERGEILTPKTDYKCIPCLKQECFQKINCMYFIKPDRVAKTVDKILKRNGSAISL